MKNRCWATFFPGSAPPAQAQQPLKNTYQLVDAAPWDVNQSNLLAMPAEREALAGDGGRPDREERAQSSIQEYRERYARGGWSAMQYIPKDSRWIPEGCPQIAQQAEHIWCILSLVEWQDKIWGMKIAKWWLGISMPFLREESRGRLMEETEMTELLGGQESQLPL